jgi:hypothetical protein
MRFNHIQLYETKSVFCILEFILKRLILVGSFLSDQYQILKLDRTCGPQLSLTLDPSIYSKHNLEQLLDTLNAGNKATGGLTRRGVYKGLLGFLQFLQGPSLLFIKESSPVALLDRHVLYQIDDTELVRIEYQPSESIADEQRYFLFIHAQISQYFSKN